MPDEEIYHIARNYVTALFQKITMDDFLPILLGHEAYHKLIGKYKGYDPTINPAIETEFSSMAFRIGHPLLKDKYQLIDKRGINVGELKLNEIFFKPDELTPEKMDLLMRGLVENIAKLREGTIIDEVRNLLIRKPDERHINLDLYALR